MNDRFDVELEAVAAGVKPACMKEGLDPSATAALLATAAKRGLAADVVHRHGRTDVGGHARGDAFATVAVARDASVLAEVQRLQRMHAVGASNTPVDAMGALMGYPACCIAAFAEHPTRGDNVENEKLPFRRSPSAVFDAHNNRLARARLISHHLCSPDCAASAALGRQLLRLFPPALAEEVRSELSRPILFVSYELRAHVEGRFENDEFVATAMRPIDGELPEYVLHASRLRLDETGIVADRDRRFDCLRPLLAVPGAALTAAAHAAIGGPIPDQPTNTERRKPPPLPGHFRRGVRAGELVLGSTDVQSDGHRIELLGGARPVVVTIRLHEDGRPYAVRRGKWAIDVADVDALDARARNAIAAIVRALPP